MPDPKTKKSEDDDHEDDLDEATEANTELDEAFNDDEPSETPPGGDDLVIPVSPD